MKKLLSLLAVVMTLGLTTVSMDAEARRIGGGKSLGMQRQAAPPQAPAATPRQAPANNATATGATPKRSWMGPIAGLAAGLGLAALASHLGFGEAFANMLMIGLLVVAAIALFGFVMRRKAAAQNGGMSYAGASAGASPAQPAAFRMPTPPASSPSSFTPAGGSMIGANLQPAAASSIPADFDVAGFARNAKVQFIRLQAAHDAGNLDDIRGFTTPQMFAEISMDIRDRGQAASQTEVVSLEADVIEVQEEQHQYVVSVRFSGSLREDGGAAEAIEEIWHLTKPVQGSGGWVLAGIQQAN